VAGARFLPDTDSFPRCAQTARRAGFGWGTPTPISGSLWPLNSYAVRPQKTAMWRVEEMPTSNIYLPSCPSPLSPAALIGVPWPIFLMLYFSITARPFASHQTCRGKPSTLSCRVGGPSTLWIVCHCRTIESALELSTVVSSSPCQTEIVGQRPMNFEAPRTSASSVWSDGPPYPFMRKIASVREFALR